MNRNIQINPLSQFYDAIRASGLEPPDHIVPGKLHRFPGIGKGKSNRAGWCVFFTDGLGGSFGDWSSGFSENWQANRNKSFSPTERDAFKRNVSKARAQAKEELIIKQARAAQRATGIWNSAIPAPANHPYLVRKGIKPFGARLHKDLIVLPVIDLTGKVNSLQFIGPDGTKKLLSGGRKHGCFIPVFGEFENPYKVIICEGWATGCTISEHYPSSLVLAAIDAGNLKPGAVATRQQWQDADLIIVGDDDQLTPGNPGSVKARAAAVASGALFALPRWPADAPKSLSDFNDLVQWIKGTYRG